MDAPSKREVKRFIRELRAASKDAVVVDCLRCGLIRAADPMTTSALSSVGIENPRISLYLCKC